MYAADLKIPAQVTAGAPLSIATSGEGNGTLYLIGPVARWKQPVQLGEAITIPGEQLRQAGQYAAILRSGDGTTSNTLLVVAANPGNINFLAQPSRVPTGRHDAISGTAFVLDRYHNLVLVPMPVRFELSLEGAPTITRLMTSRDGLAWTRMDSSSRAGNAQFTATSGNISVVRVVQQTASDPCNLRMHAQPIKNGILVETDPVRDCSGNPVPDGTIVTFTDIDPSGKSTVDAAVKRGVARAQLPAAPHANISAASGIVIGNEIHWGGGR